MKDERKQPGGYLLPPSLWGILQFTSRWRIEQVVPSTRSNSQYEAGKRRFVRFRPKSWSDTPKSVRFRLGYGDPFDQEVHIENC